MTVTDADIYSIILAALVVAVLMKYIYSRLLVTAFDEEVAKVGGVAVNRMNMIFAILTALVVVMGMSVVGILLISALMIIPVASAHLWHVGFAKTLWIAEAYAVGAVIAGLFGAFYFDIAPGGTIVMTAIALYILTFVLSYGRR